MGLFDKLFASNLATKQSTPPIHIYDENEAFVAILFCCLYADGDAADGEIDAFCRYIITRPAFAGLPITDMYRKYAAYYYQVKSIQPIIETAMPMINEGRKPQLFATAVDFVLADGIVDEKEKQLLEDLQQGLNIDEALATKVIEVLMLKNSSVF